MTRRLSLFVALLLVPLVLCSGADPAQEVWDLLTQVASALSERNPAAFLAAFDPAMPGYQKVRANVLALLRDAEVQSSIELEAGEGDAEERTVELDWLLKIRPEQDATPSTRRQQRVQCRLRKSGKKWRIVWFEPLEFLAPPAK
jgi:murein L,D-transpeptidase YcbB/YkuD